MYEVDEKETHICTSDIEDHWEVYTRQKKIMTRLKNAGYEPVKVEVEGDKVIAATYHLDLNKISFKKAIVNKREYTDEERRETAERLAKARLNK